MLLRLLLPALLALGLLAPAFAGCRPRTGEAPPGQVGGRRFGNDGSGGEQKLPLRDDRGRRISYLEWDIHPRRPEVNRGPERIITGSDGRAWYTADHDCSFTEMRR